MAHKSNLHDLLPSDPLRWAPDAARPLRVRARALDADTRIVPHRHAWAQVAFSATGVVRLTAGRHTYIVPPSRAVWIPPGVEHAVTVMDAAELRTLYLLLPAGRPMSIAEGGRQGSGEGGSEQGSEQGCEQGRDEANEPGSAAASAWQQCRVLEVSPLLRELVAQLLALPEAQPHGPREATLARLLQDELCRARPVSLGVGLPQDSRLRSLCEAVLADPARHSTLAGWAAGTGASVRTVARLFRTELDTSFAEWRQQVLLAQALSMAARRQPMAHIATALGFRSASAFSAMVRRTVGQPPSRFFRADGMAPLTAAAPVAAGTSPGAAGRARR